jgi:hypothetical protein
MSNNTLALVEDILNDPIDMLSDLSLNSELEEFHDSFDMIEEFHDSINTFAQLEMMELEDIPINNLGELDVSNHNFQPEELFSDSFCYDCDDDEDCADTKEQFFYKKNECHKDMKSSSKPQFIISSTKAPFASNKNEFHEDMLSTNIIQESSHYPDFSLVTDEEAMKYITEQGKGKRKKSSAETFPKKLHKIVERSEIDGYSDIINWLPHGRAFMIHDAKKFNSDILSKYFYLSQFASFKRQLKIYGFRKITLDGHDKGAYYNELFLRGRPGLCEGITRFKFLSNFKSEPNFYTMPPVVPGVVTRSSYPRAVTYCESNSSNEKCGISHSAPVRSTSVMVQNPAKQVVSKLANRRNMISVNDLESRKRVRVIRRSSSLSKSNSAMSYYIFRGFGL